MIFARKKSYLCYSIGLFSAWQAPRSDGVEYVLWVFNVFVSFFCTILLEAIATPPKDEHDRQGMHRR